MTDNIVFLDKESKRVMANDAPAGWYADSDRSGILYISRGPQVLVLYTENTGNTAFYCSKNAILVPLVPIEIVNLTVKEK